MELLIQTDVSLTLTDPQYPGETATSSAGAPQVSFTQGTSARQFDRVTTATLPSGTNTSLSLSSGAALNRYGVAQVFARVCYFQAFNPGTVNATLTGNFLPQLPGAPTSIILTPGGVYLSYDLGQTSYAVTASTADTITMAVTGGASVNFCAAGRSV